MNVKLKLALLPLAVSAAVTHSAAIPENLTEPQVEGEISLFIEQRTQAFIDRNSTAPGLIINYKQNQNANLAQNNSLMKATRSSKSFMGKMSNQIGSKIKHHKFMWDNRSHVVKFEKMKSVAELKKISAQLIALNSDIDSIEIDHWMVPYATVNDTRFNEQWHYMGDNNGMNATGAWDITRGAGVNVAVIDTGYRPHADLAANIVGGYDFITNATTGNDGNGRDSDARDPGDWTTGQCGRASNSSWHGTHVAGTIAAVSNNNFGIAGVAYESKVVPLRVLGTCGGSTSDIADSMVWASGGSISGIPNNPNPAKVLNLSLGSNSSSPCSNTSQDAINQARANGAVVVVAAGNSNANLNTSPYNPASCNGTITVAATDSSGNRSIFSGGQASSFGLAVDVAAPGSNILSTLNSGNQGPSADSYAFYAGTSMATPHVAGVAALMFAVNPNLTPDEVEQKIKESVKPFPSGSTCNTNICGPGLLDARAAVLSAQGNTPPPGGGNELTKGVAKLNISGAASSETRYTFNVPAGSSNVTFNIAGGTGDADLYVKFGSEPTVAAAANGQCRPWLSGNIETCNFATTEAGTYHVMLVGYSTYSGVSLTADYTAGSNPPPGGGAVSFENTNNFNIPDNNTTGITSTISSTRTGQSGTVSVDVNIVHTYKGDLIVDVIHPDGTVYNVHNRTGGSANNIVSSYSVNAGTKQSDGDWKLRVRDRAGQDVGYINSWKITFN